MRCACKSSAAQHTLGSSSGRIGRMGGSPRRGASFGFCSGGVYSGVGLTVVPALSPDVTMGECSCCKADDLPKSLQTPPGSLGGVNSGGPFGMPGSEGRDHSGGTSGVALASAPWKVLTITGCLARWGVLMTLAGLHRLAVPPATEEGVEKLVTVLWKP